MKSAVDYIVFDLDSPKVAERSYESVLEKAQLFVDVPRADVTPRTLRSIDTGYCFMLI